MSDNEDPVPYDEDADAEPEDIDDAGEAGTDADPDDLPPDHPLFKRLQDDLRRQLGKLYDTIEEETREKLAVKAKLEEQREQVGVELYSIQQQLAKLQTQLQDANEERATAEAERLEKESRLKEERQQLEDAHEVLKQRNKEFETQRNELDKLNEIVLSLEKYNQDKANEVAVVRRETYKSEQAAAQTEAVKQEQDLYIDKLMHQPRDVGAEVAIIEAQILAQRGETKTARDAILQASLEMEKINFERNHLLQEWNSALIGVKRRSITLADVEAAALKQEEEIRTLQNEHEGLKQQIRDQQEQTERQSQLVTKVKSRVQYLDGQIAEAMDKRKHLQSELEKFYELISAKEKDVSRVLKERTAARYEFKNAEKGTNEISNQIHEIEDQILKHVAEQSDLKRDAVAAQHVVEKVREQISAKDRELSELQNETVRLRIDKLNISAHKGKLEKALNEIIKELQTKDELISQYENQMRRNNVDIEKKQSEVDKLNRKYDLLTQAQGGEEFSPLEREIRDMKAKIQTTDEKMAEIQASWLKKQTELVTLSRSCEDIDKTNQTHQAHLSVMSRKRDRVLKQLQVTEKEIEKLQADTRVLQREMSRLGEQLSASVGQGNVLVEGNLNFEAEILETLRKKEAQAASVEGQIEQLATAREQLAEDLIETEKTIMLWEKKIQLAKEMRSALDPNFGASELNSMRKEVNRMEHRLKQIKRQQEVIIQEIQFAMKRRETIATKGQAKQRTNKDRTRGDLARGINQLKRQIQEINNETEKQVRHINENAESQRELETGIEQLQHVERELRSSKSDHEKRMQEEEQSRITRKSKLEKLQAKNRLFQSQKTLLKSVDGFEAAYSNLKNQEEQLIGLIDILAADFPHLADTLSTIKARTFVV